MDIIDLVIPILVILLSALNPLIKSFQKKMSEAKKQAEAVNPQIPNEMDSKEDRFTNTENIHVFKKSKRIESPDMITTIHRKAESAASKDAQPTVGNEVADDLRRDLSEPKNLKRAVILSEILNRKHS